MIELTRRTLLASTVAATAVAVAPLATGRSGHAAAPPAGTQAPGWYRYKLGSFEITVVTDGVNRFKLPDNLVSNAKREDVIAALAAARLPPDIFVTPYNPIVVAGSTGRRNTGVKFLCRGFKSQGLAWPLIELAGHFVEMGLRVHRQVGSFRKILSQQAIGVLVGTALPWTLRIAKVNIDVGR
jgi:hypothetical protein